MFEEVFKYFIQISNVHFVSYIYFLSRIKRHKTTLLLSQYECIFQYDNYVFMTDYDEFLSL
jgi:hypothetical protein